MKLTESMLRKIIREEASKLVEMGRMGYIGRGIKTAAGTPRDANASQRDINTARAKLALAKIKQDVVLATQALDVFVRFPSTCGPEIRDAAEVIATASSPTPSPSTASPEEMSPEEMSPEEMFESRRLRRRR